jgi:NitT/TauT family transport system permease protein
MNRAGLVRVRRTVITVAILLLLWQLAATAYAKPYILPTVTAVLSALVSDLRDGNLLSQIQVSLGRALAGYALAVCLAIPAGILTGWWKLANDTVGSVLELIRPIPALALIPLAIVWLGFGEVPKIAMIAYASFFSVYINTQTGVRNVDPLHIKVMRVYGNGTRDILTKVVLYSMLPYVFAGLRYSAAVALILLVAVELVGSQNGLGFFLFQSQAFLQVPDIFAAILVFGLMGFTANLLILALERRVIRWRQEVGAES